jgi:spoIIIJ-associated protein
MGGTHTPEQVDEALDIIAEFLEETLVAIDVGSDLEVDLQYRDGEVVGTLDGDADDVALIIGKRGQTLDAIQYVANAVMIAGMEKPVRVTLDAQGYRERRAVNLKKIAERAAKDVVKFGESIELDPMTSSERKVIHLHLKDNPEVETESSGRDPQRRVVVHPA